MAPSYDTTMPATRRARKSTSGYSPSKAVDKENATIDFSTTANTASAAASRKKSRSKSMGPGGLDALKSSSGNRRASLAVPSRPPPRSILKPTMPILPDIPPLKTKARAASKGSPSRGAASADENAGKKVALRTEEEQQAAAKEREERERVAREKEIKDYREARRKSLANRRVSFAAEATLHTFHEIEYMQDSTTSTDSTRRASSIAAPSPVPPPSLPQQRTDDQAHQAQNGPHYGSDDASEPPSTPPEQVEDDMVMESPANQRSMHQKNRRRSSTGVSALGFDSPGSVADDDITITSTVYDSDGDDVEIGDDLEDVDSDAESVDSDSDEGDGATMVTVGGEETSASVLSAISARSASPIESTSDLDEALRLATQHAGAHADETKRQRPIGEDEEIIPAFIGWGKKAGTASSQPVQQEQDQSVLPDDDGPDDSAMDMDMDMDMTSAMGGIIRSRQALQGGEMTMDVTRSYGGIISQRPGLETDSVASSPMIMPEDTIVDDAPMDLTTAIGGIKLATDFDTESVNNEGLEDMSMELTTVMGGVLTSGPNKARRLSRRQTIRGAEEDEDDFAMDMTVGVGKILVAENATNDEEDDESMDMTMGMDITSALGGIIKPASPTRTIRQSPRRSKQSSPVRTVAATPTKSAKSPAAATKSPRSTAKKSPGSAFKGKGLERTPAPGKNKNGERSKSTPTKPDVGTTKEAKTPSTPTRPSPAKATSSASKSKSPKRAASAEKSTTPRSPPKSTAPTPKSPFTQSQAKGVSTPTIVLTPQGRPWPRQSAFTGAGPASPKITEIFNRRSSLVDSANEFVVGSAQKERPAVSFAEPEPVHQSTPEGANGLQDDREATQNLKDLIQGLSPKKNLFKGRKSLHVGSARGLLGKRPMELDEEEDELEGPEFVKRIKGHEPSPVKSIRLQQPPSVMETIGRSSRSRRSPSATPLPVDLQNTPKRNVVEAGPVEIGAISGSSGVEADPEHNEDHIHLQDFLNMANIHFMELETTKRRPTELPSSFKSNGVPGDDDSKDPEVESLVTSICKVPLLEMYQHACRELKNYIEEGRSIMREIETETYEDNPPIFNEYMTATPEMRSQMDGQFKNIKIFARLQSKKQWYEWRTKLHQGLQEGMLKTLNDLEQDQEVMRKRRETVDAVYPALLAEYEALEQERVQLERFVQQLGGEDREKLIAARRQKSQLKATIDSKKSATTKVEAETQESKARVAAMKAEREQYLKELEESKRIQEERRSWSQQEISTLKAQVDALEKKSGWAVTGAQGTTLSLAYRREIELVFDVASFRPGQANSQIDIWYIGHTRVRDPQPFTSEKKFFMQCIRDHVRGLRQAETKPARLLKVVRASWDAAQEAANQIRQINLTFPTTTTKTSDTSIALAISVLLVPLQTRIEAKLHLHCNAGDGPLSIAISTEARVVYGEPFNAPKMGEFLATRIGNCVVAHRKDRDREDSNSVEYWIDAVEELKARLLARGRK